MIEYVAGFLFSGFRSRVALIQKNKPDWQRGKWNGIGGKIEPGETPHDAMVREFREETEVHVTEWRPFCELRGPGWVVHFFTAIGDYSIGACQPTDELVSWIDLPLPADLRILPNLRWLIPMALDEDNVIAHVEDNSSF